MQGCDKCGQEFEELITQPNGEGFCLNCHRGLGPDFSDMEYNRLRMMYDKDVNFKKLRHRFWALGLQRRYNVLRTNGYLKEGETLFEKVERFRLYKIKESGLEGKLVELIGSQEAEILADNEKSDFLAPRGEPRIEGSGRVHAGRVNLRPGGSNPWGESQE